MTTKVQAVNDLFNLCLTYQKGFEGCQILKCRPTSKDPKVRERLLNKSPREVCEKCTHALFEIVGLTCLSCKKPVSRVLRSKGPTTWQNWPEHCWHYYKCDSCRTNCYSHSDLG